MEEINLPWFNDSILSILKENCGIGAEKVRHVSKRGQKIIPAGQPILQFHVERNLPDDQPSSSKGTKKETYTFTIVTWSSCIFVHYRLSIIYIDTCNWPCALKLILSYSYPKKKKSLLMMMTGYVQTVMKFRMMMEIVVG